MLGWLHLKWRFYFGYQQMRNSYEVRKCEAALSGAELHRKEDINT